VLRINVLGGLYVTGEGRPLSGAAAQPRRLALLALVAVAGDRGVTRDSLLAHLWPDADEERGRRALTQALYALRRDLGSDDSLLGLKDLRLNPDLVTADVIEFRSALSAGDLERAAELYRGPFLEGFNLPGSDTFERWMEEQRGALARDFQDLLGQLGERCLARGDAKAAVGWFRRLAAVDPLNAGVATALMQALARTGDVAGALQHARVYEALLRQELDLPPDRQVVELAERLRKGVTEPATPGDAPARGAAPPTPARSQQPAATAAAQPELAEAEPMAPRVPQARTDPGPTSGWARLHLALSSPAPAPGKRPRLPRAALTAGLLLTGMLAILFWREWPERATVSALEGQPRVIAVGRNAHYTQEGHGSLGPPLADMLATNLARVGSLRVISHVRMVEVTRQLGLAGDSTAVAAAARKAGATELVDGALYEVGGGVLRLDLRRVDLGNGAVLQAYTCQGADLFALADSSTGELVRDLGVSAPTGSLADVSTRSVSAYRAYEAGLGRFYSGDVAAAEQLFAEALRADSNFAMAAYYHAISENAGDRPELFRRFRRAVLLAEKASDRERLLILAAWAFYNSSPRTGAYADTLIIRYPAEVAGYYYRGQNALSAGEFLRAREALTEVVMRDSLGFRVESERCLACDALKAIGYSYALADSQVMAARFARRWADRQPFSAAAWRNLAVAWAFAGPAFGDSAEAAWQAADSVAPGSAANRLTLAYVRFRAERYADAERIYRAELEGGARNDRLEARWQLANLLRQLGRLREALEHAREYRRLLLRQARVDGAQYAALLEAQILRERGNARAAAALFDSVAHDTPREVDVAFVARNRVWAWVHMSDALASLGDTVRLPRLADSMRVLGQESGLLRDRMLHHHVRGLLALRRGDAEEAARLFRLAIASPNHGYTRTNYELASALMTLGRHAEAVATLQAALRGAVDGSNLYITRTLLHERLAEAWEAAGGRDSAAAHYELVVKHWDRADPALVARREQARAGVARLRQAP